MDLAALGPYGVVVAGLALGVVGFPLPEELLLLGAGAAVHRGLASFAVMIPVAVVAVVLVDCGIFAIGRRFGPAALVRAPAKWLLPARRRARMERLVHSHGPPIIFAARFLPGLRASTFLVLGSQRVPLRRFVLYDGLAAAISVPLMISIGYLASSSVQRIAADMARADHYLVLGIAIVIAVVAIVSVLRMRRPALAPS